MRVSLLISKFLICALTGYLLLVLLVFAMQRKLLYLHDKQPVTEQHAQEKGLRHWPTSENFRGFTSLKDTVAADATIVLFHGNAGAAHHREHFLHTLSQYNFRVVLAEYPGYGGRAGTPSEKVLVDDALETIRLVHQQYGEPILLWGESMGSGVVAGTVANIDVPTIGLVLMLPWDSLPDLAQTHYWYLPARWLVKDQYNSVENLMRYKGNVAVLLAEKDEVIPVVHGRRLFDSISANKKLWLFENASHNYIPLDSDMAWWKEVREFILN